MPQSPLTASRVEPPAGTTTGGVRTLLRIESATILVVLLAAYQQQQASWWLFAALFLAPDLAMLPYLGSRTAGAAAYNTTHTYVAPAVLLVIASASNGALLMTIATIWAAHIAFDRALGYGLKYASGFSDTHLGRVGTAGAGR